MTACDPFHRGEGAFFRCLPGLRATGLAIACAFLVGCAALGKVGGPEPIAPTAADLAIIEAGAQEGAARKKFGESRDEAARREIRDSYVLNRLALIDIRFIGYVRSLSGDRRNLDSATEAAQLTLSVWATLTDSVQAATNLAAAVAIVTGLKGNVDKNYYGNKGTDAILSMMTARRKEVLARIIRSLNADTNSYSMLSAKVDVDEYEQAGTMDGASLVIHAEAAKKEAKAQESIKGQQLVRNIQANLGAPAQADKRQLTRSLDPKAVSLETASKALQNLGVEKSELPSDLDAALEVLQEAVRNARTAEQVAQVKKAFEDAGLQLK
jgi:hypothetical protein